MPASGTSTAPNCCSGSGWTPGSWVRPAGAGTAGQLWDDTVAVMADGVRDGRIITTGPRYWTSPGGESSRRKDPGCCHFPAPEDAHFVYRRHGQECRVCGTAVSLVEHAARKLYWCPVCQGG